MAEEKQGKIFFDHVSTTPVDPRVLKVMLPYFTERFGNPSSHIHEAGVIAGRALEAARGEVASLISANPSEIIFTSGATESNNLAIRGFLQANRGKGNHLIFSEIEHYSVINLAHTLKREGYEVTFLKVDRQGLVDPEDLRRRMRTETCLVSVMLANPEIGTIEPIRTLAGIAKEHGVYFHTDAACAAGIIPVDVGDLKIDALTLSAHNFYGPKGVGALYLRQDTKLSALFQGGFQENGIRPGTENLPAIVGFGEASRLSRSEMEFRNSHLRNLGKRLRQGLENSVEFLHFTGHPEKRLPGHVSLWVEYVEGESLLLMLNLKGVMAASGSACSSNLKGRDETDLSASHVLTAVGVPPEFCSGSLTFSLGKDNSEEQINYLVEIMPPIVERLLEMSPLYADRVQGEKYSRGELSP
jgi:cysteine desulfurase